MARDVFRLGSLIVEEHRSYSFCLTSFAFDCSLSRTSTLAVAAVAATCSRLFIFSIQSTPQPQTEIDSTLETTSHGLLDSMTPTGKQLLVSRADTLHCWKTSRSSENNFPNPDWNGTPPVRRNIHSYVVLGDDPYPTGINLPRPAWARRGDALMVPCCAATHTRWEAASLAQLQRWDVMSWKSGTRGKCGRGERWEAQTWRAMHAGRTGELGQWHGRPGVARCVEPLHLAVNTGLVLTRIVDWASSVFRFPREFEEIERRSHDHACAKKRITKKPGETDTGRRAGEDAPLVVPSAYALAAVEGRRRSRQGRSE